MLSCNEQKSGLEEVETKDGGRKQREREREALDLANTKSLFYLVQQAALGNETGGFLSEGAKQKKGFVSKCSCSNRLPCACVCVSR